jgi:phosphoenolpyruvate synthase/pyruvate phosphate dikinase
MRYIVTLANVSRSQAEELGFRAVDLAVLKEKGFNIPLTFIVNSEAFEDFLAENGLRAKIERSILEKPDRNEAYQEIMSHFVKSKFPKELESELHEAYASLSIEPGGPAHSLISDHDSPFVTLARSPSYILETEDEEGILQNIKGPEQFAIALKLIWSSIFSPESKNYRENAKLSEKSRMSVIVQKMKKTSITAVAYSRTEFNEYMIRVKSFRGYPDYSEPILGKDVHEVDMNSLLIRAAQVNTQEYQLMRDIESDELVKRPMLDEGGKQKLNDKLVCECARIAKRCKSFIGKDVKLYFSIFDELINILQVNRMTLDTAKEVEEQEEILATTDQTGATIVESLMEREVKVNTAKETFKMPTLLSQDEANNDVVQTMGHKLFTLTGFLDETTENSKDDVSGKIESGPKVEVIPKEKTVSSAEYMIEAEENLLEQVLKIKELIERMEEHALNNNKESYDQEAKKIKQMLKNIREE